MIKKIERIKDVELSDYVTHRYIVTKISFLGIPIYKSENIWNG